MKVAIGRRRAKRAASSASGRVTSTTERAPPRSSSRGQTAYVDGDAFTPSTATLGFPKSRRQAVRENVGSRCRAQATSSPFPAEAAARSRPSRPDSHPKRNVERRRRGRWNGPQLVGVRGTTRHHGIPFVEAVYAVAGGKPLPIAEPQIAPTAGFRASRRWAAGTSRCTSGIRGKRLVRRPGRHHRTARAQAQNRSKAESSGTAVTSCHMPVAAAGSRAPGRRRARSRCARPCAR